MVIALSPHATPATYARGDDNIHNDFRARLARVAGGRAGLAVCDLGGGAHPFFSPAEIAASQYDYSVLDISREQLAMVPAHCRRVECDIAGNIDAAHDMCDGRSANLKGTFDLAFSNMLAEHVRDAAAFHRNVFAILKPGGSAFHLFPTLFTVPFLANLLLPERVATLANRVLSPATRRARAKFPAYYHWCRGPLPSAIRRLERIGFEVVEYRGYFGHSYYRRFPPLDRLHRWKTRLLEAHPLPMFTSYALLHYQKPLNSS
jgi:SAM-dependent methyltransferase